MVHNLFQSAKKPGHIRFDADDEPNCSANEQINPTDHEDRRFQMDQRFEGDDELDQENSEFPTDDLEAETERNRQILAKVLSSHSVEEKKEEMTTETKSFVVDDEFAKELRKKAEKTETEIKPFSLLAAFGRNAVEKEEKLVEQPKIIGKPYESHQKFETDAAPVQQPVKKRSDPAKFFFTPNDPRILSKIE